MRKETSRRKEERKPNADEKQVGDKRFKVNNMMLSLMLKDNVKLNDKMDRVLILCSLGRRS